MRHKGISGRLAMLSLSVVFVLWYRDTLAEMFGPAQSLFPASDRGTHPQATVTQPATPPQQASVHDTCGGGPGEDFGVAAPQTLENVDDFVRAIFDPADATFERLACPVPPPSVLARYETLSSAANTRRNTALKIFKYYFALDVTQVVDLLPRLVGSVVEAIRFLGPQHCVLSIVGGNSDDGTTLVLDAIRPELDALGIGRYFFETSSVDPPDGPPDGHDQRQPSSANMRNLVLKPMLDNRRLYSEDTTIIFLNDVAICMEDILELAYQRIHLGADMTCAMDWNSAGRDPIYYDVWGSRTLTGESFSRDPEGKGSWDEAWNLFWNDYETKSRYSTRLPFQVFSCWSGAVTLTADPILYGDLGFRNPDSEECFHEGPALFCKDLWYKGWGKISVVPSVSLEHSTDQGRSLKALKGYTSTWVGPEQDEKSKIRWQQLPPEQVKCMKDGGARLEALEETGTGSSLWSRKAKRWNRKHQRR
ncbi:hypothetical protein KVR01_010946 [Diaporthe batatas]|uniref:uncharacterized protein n=1 Tax=Diaporthe batatas TaxID=748121 RepID=UPI001D044DE0|nr:uncharacterized protein KVR01_010946 [Diaporthe batatas]KAG8159285.1 hypothetical protein KVR01_010946 [Diaporthe batatas]